MTQALRIPFVIGTGSGGSRIVSRLLIPGITRIAVNSSWRDLEALPANIVKVRAGDGSGSGMDSKKGERDYLKGGGREELFKAADKILEERKLSRGEVDLIPVIISAGFGFGTGSGPKIVEDLQKRFPKSAILAWVTLPFYHEGDETRKNAIRCFRSVASKAAAIAIDNQHVATMMGADLTLKDLFSRINARIAQSLITLLRAASPNTLTTIDRSDLRRVLGKGGVLMFSKKFKPGTRSFSKLFDSDASLSPYTPGERPCKVRALAVIQSPKAPSPVELSNLTKQCEKSLNIRLKAFKSVITLGGESMKISILLGGLAH